MDKIRHAEEALKDDSTVLHKILKDLLAIKETTSLLKESVQ